MSGAWFLFACTCVCWGGSFPVCGWEHCPCYLWGNLVCSAWFLARSDCLRPTPGRNGPLGQSPPATWQRMPRTSCTTYVGIGFRACPWPPCMPCGCNCEAWQRVLPTRYAVFVASLPSPRIWYPLRMPQMATQFPSLPAPLSSSLAARPTNGVVCATSHFHLRSRPPTNSICLCGLTLPTLASAGPRGGDSM